MEPQIEARRAGYGECLKPEVTEKRGNRGVKETGETIESISIIIVYMKYYLLITKRKIKVNVDPNTEILDLPNLSQLARQHATSNGTCWLTSTLQKNHRRHLPVQSDFFHSSRRHPVRMRWLLPNICLFVLINN